MSEEVRAFLAEVDRKLVALESQLVGKVAEPQSLRLLGMPRELVERCRVLGELGSQVNSMAVSQLVVDVYALEKLAGGALACEQHPNKRATRTWKGAPTCRECYEQLELMAAREAK